MASRNNNYQKGNLTPQEIAEQVGRTPQAVYRCAKRLGRLPTIEEYTQYSKQRYHKYSPVDLSLNELQNASGYSRQAILNLAKKIKRLPSLEELKTYKQTRKLGRPRKY